MIDYVRYTQILSTYTFKPEIGGENEQTVLNVENRRKIQILIL